MVITKEQCGLTRRKNTLNLSPFGRVECNFKTIHLNNEANGPYCTIKFHNYLKHQIQVHIPMQIHFFRLHFR